MSVRNRIESQDNSRSQTYHYKIYEKKISLLHVFLDVPFMAQASMMIFYRELI